MPSIEFCEFHRARFVQPGQERERVQVVERQPVAIDSQEGDGSLGEAPQKFRMFRNELVGSQEKWRPIRHFPPLQVADEPALG